MRQMRKQAKCLVPVLLMIHEMLAAQEWQVQVHKMLMHDKHMQNDDEYGELQQMSDAHAQILTAGKTHNDADDDDHGPANVSLLTR